MCSVMNAIARPWHRLMEIQLMKCFFFLAPALLYGAVEAVRYIKDIYCFLAHAEVFLYH